MRISIWSLGLPLAALLGACSPVGESDVAASAQPTATEPTETVTGTDAAQCGADKLAGFIDAVPNDETLAKIKAQIGDKTIRVINPGDAVTMDFRPDRLNIENGDDGRIEKFGCY